MAKFAVLFALLGVASATFLRRDIPELPAKEKDGSFATQGNACQACSHFAQQSEAYSNSCVCYAANVKAFGATAGGFKTEMSDPEDWKWTCTADSIVIGSNYKPCNFGNEGRMYSNQFGDVVDPNAK